ncbi:MAG: DEAD/DEAH box helicase [Terriglobia bacterium]
MPFSQLGLQPELARALSDANYVRPTPIQSKAIPVILRGCDVVGTAQTGTGKTAAFLLPLLQRLASPSHQTRGLVLTPTRELATQVEAALRKYGRFLKLRSVAIYGGVSQKPQVQALRRGVDVLVATPGRLLDLIQQRCINLAAVEILVLDEADRMLDMGFLPDIQKVVQYLPKQRQTILFSATMPPPIRELAASLQKNSVLVEVGNSTTPAPAVAQKFFPVPFHLKSNLLLNLISRETMNPLLVFTRTKQGADRLHTFLGNNGVASARIHSGLTQGQRQEAMNGFRQSRWQILIATDIAARGIDVHAISHVINFDIPNNAEDYTHRIGRTGRAERAGVAYTFVSPEDETFARVIEKSVGRKLERVRVEDFDYGTPPKARAMAAASQSKPNPLQSFLSPAEDRESSPKVFDRVAFGHKIKMRQSREKAAPRPGKKSRHPSARRREHPPRTTVKSGQEGWLGLPSSEEDQELRRIRLKLFGDAGGNHFRNRSHSRGNSRSR